MDQSAFDLASIHSMAAGEDESFGSRAADWITKGLPAALASGGISMVNTGIALGNVLGADLDKIDTGAAIASFDDDIGQYYAENKAGVDLAGFVLTSLAPGVAGIKALKMLQGGTAGVNAARVTGALKTTALEPPSFLANPLAYTAKQEAFFTEKALDKIRLGANEVFAALDKDKISALVAGAADQALQGAAFETAVLLTMNQSPIISKEDEGYFTSIAGNFWSIPKAAALQGAIGGVLGGAVSLGKFAGFKREVDRAQMAGVHSGRLGASELAAQPGTALAFDYSLLANKIDEFNVRKVKGDLTDQDITNYTRTIKNFTNQLRAQGTKELAASNEDALAVQGLFDLISKSETPAETANILFGAAKTVRRITSAEESEGPMAARVFSGEGQLPERMANNLLKRGKIVEGSFPSATEEQIAEWGSMLDENGVHVYDAWRDTAGNFHTLDSAYVKQILKHPGKFINPPMIVKFAGDGAGTASTTAFPVLGDVAKKSILVSKDGETLLVDGAEYIMPPGGFNPIKNVPLTSDAQFIHASLRDLKQLASETPTVIAYHGTGAKQAFENIKVGTDGVAWFSKDPQLATAWSDVSATVGKGQARVLQSKISGNLYEYDAAGKSMYQVQTEAFNQAKALGKSGIKFSNVIDSPNNALATPQTVFAVFDPKTVKLLGEMSPTQQRGATTAYTIPSGSLVIQKGDLPLLEAAARKGFDGEVFLGDQPITGDVMGQMQDLKIELRQDMIEAGHGFDRIARELNTTRDWAETGRGDGFILNEDHTKPLHALIDYETGFLESSQVIRGVADLQTLVTLGKEQNEKVAAIILGKNFAALPSTKGALFDVTTLPETANFLRSTSGEYGTTLSYFQQSGKVVHQAIQERTQAIYQSLQGAEAALKADPKAVLEANIVLNKFRAAKDPLFRWVDKNGVHFVPEPIYKKMQTALKAGDEKTVADLLGDKSVWKIQNKVAEDYFLQNIAIESERSKNWNLIFAARGSAQYYNPDRVHLPPLDTTKFSHINFIKEKMDVPGRAQEVGVVVGHTPEDLAAKVDRIKAAYEDRFEIYTASDIKLYKQAQGEWETGPMLGDSLTDQAMRSEGKLYEFQPRIDKEFINDFNNWHWRQENNVVRNAVELKYAQEFAEIRAMARRFDESKFGPKGKEYAKNPYNQYIKTALDISNYDRYNSVWGKINDATERVGSGMIDAWKNSINQAQSGAIDWELANSTAEKYGFRAPYKDAIASIVQPRIPNARALEPLIAKMNGSLATVTLGLDFLNSVVNVLSFPIMALSEMKSLQRQIIREQGEATGAISVGNLTKLTGVQIPGRPELLMPSPMRLLTNSIIRLFKDEGAGLAYYKDIGAVKDLRALGTEVYASSRLTAESVSNLESFAGKAKEIAEKAGHYGRMVTGANKAETWVRYLAADMMKQITDSAGIAVSDAPAYINTFVNRVHGNYMANQRPHLFQGVVGQAISLFQTYQFNVMQNMIRYVGAGDKTAAAMLFGMQNTIFGVQGNPAFYLLNQAVGNANPEHIDFLSGSRMLVGPEVSDWVMYGLGSNALHTTLYNRGDLTPRYVTVVPTQLKDVPAISIPLKAITSFYDAAVQIAKGANTGTALLNGLAHFGANRPLAGLAQLSLGYRTSSKGDLLTAYNDIDGITIAAKLSGGEEFNRAIAMDAYYRNLAYKAYDNEKKQQLGEVVKNTMYSGKLPTEDQVTQFMSEYTRAGGAPQSFNRWMRNEFKHATQSQLNVLKAHVNSPTGRLQATMMGADTQDFWYNPPAAAPQTEE